MEYLSLDDVIEERGCAAYSSGSSNLYLVIIVLLAEAAQVLHGKTGIASISSRFSQSYRFQSQGFC